VIVIFADKTSGQRHLSATRKTLLISVVQQGNIIPILNFRCIYSVNFVKVYDSELYLYCSDAKERIREKTQHNKGIRNPPDSAIEPKHQNRKSPPHFSSFQFLEPVF
jgi:hypothetical protein